MQPEHEGAAEVARWMLTEGIRHGRMREVGEEMCRRIVAVGIPLRRVFCFIGALHPQVAVVAYVWNRGDTAVTRMLGEHGIAAREEVANSPLMAVRRSGREIRRRLCDPDCPIDFPVLAQHREAGATDYLAVPMIFSNGEVNAITFLIDRPGGFTESEAAGLREIAHALGIVTELESSRRTAQSLLETYIGRRTGERVLAGAITRGSGETIRAVIWYCDLRGFTALVDRLPLADVAAMLNDYFEIMAGAVIAEGGEVLKFIGDGMLAIFDLCGGEDATRCCAAALRAARAALAAIAAANPKRVAAGVPEMRFGLALHLGEVYYGNIGAPSRLDFTVIGPAVNQATRLEKLGSDLGHSVVTSASFATAAAEPLASLGFHQLRGVAGAQEIFAPPR